MRLRMNTNCKTSFYTIIVAILVHAGCTCTTIAPCAYAQGLDELLQSPALQKLNKETRNSEIATTKDLDEHSNFASIWQSSSAPLTLTTWLGARIYGYKILSNSARLFKEYAGAEALLANADRVKVHLTVQVPRPSYTIMAQYKTLESFNRFRPPLLDSIAEQSMKIQGVEATYYRTRLGECSLVFNTERLGIVNLRVEKCIDSRVMMDIAKRLNFERLNQKLKS